MLMVTAATTPEARDAAPERTRSRARSEPAGEAADQQPRDCDNPCRCCTSCWGGRPPESDDGVSTEERRRDDAARNDPSIGSIGSIGSIIGRPCQLPQ
jgi:hypothetical protein